MPKKRIHIYYAGVVQGVGFRFTAERIALDLDLTGWVRNLPDGRVEVLMEGENPKIKKFLKKIDESFLKGYIDDVDIEWHHATGEFDTFQVRFY